MFFKHEIVSHNYSPILWNWRITIVIGSQEHVLNALDNQYVQFASSQPGEYKWSESWHARRVEEQVVNFTVHQLIELQFPATLCIFT